MGIDTEETMIELIEKAKSIRGTRFDPIKDINLFNILGMENKEVTAHSAFLYYIFKPFRNEKNTTDDTNLRFLYKILRKKLIEKNTGFDYPESPTFLDIEREKAFSCGRLDFLISYSNGVKEDAIIIELKIWAGEQFNQIERYKSYLEDNGYSSCNIFFLTPTERDSQTGDSINITLKNDIIPVLKSIREFRKDCDSYKTIINQYITTIEKITKGENKMGTEYKSFIKSYDDILAVNKLNEMKTQAMTDMLINFMNEIKNRFIDKLQDGGYGAYIVSKDKEIEFDDRYINDDYLKKYYISGQSCYPAIRIKLKKNWLKEELKQLLDKENADNNYYPCFYIEIEDRLYAGLTIKCGDLDYFDIEKAKNWLKGISTNNSKWWVDWNYIQINGKNINFRDYNISDESFFRIFDGLTIKKDYANEIVEKAFNILETIRGKFLTI